MNARIIQRGSGIGRNPWAIREEMAKRGLNITKLASLAQAHTNIASDTIRGIRNHKRTLDVLEGLGIPKELLYPEQTILGKAA